MTDNQSFTMYSEEKTLYSFRYDSHRYQLIRITQFVYSFTAESYQEEIIYKLKVDRKVRLTSPSLDYVKKKMLHQITSVLLQTDLLCG